ncbi:MAG TPA: phasin family protein [Accumulibacter sp.]|uniref:phasin family protein n=1 Tax=Accumulibacter sp. TaxID=2053492 RepID=UPI0026063A29|nr:phasin family protein [Accumulibacter sp.]MDS4053582.1 phasin family protein [Accumulibacter sp.]HMV05264.1 phasin family protein [Accumulibacter sp.]HMW62812.1 phasin family protein [Accumulibacter sp.]HMW79841.1 phasin family protein [Accumulibacter sp.]HMX68123.1 phasin family protein [Accumulibacter sp.]
MGKKLRDLAGGLADNQLAMTVKESAQQIWLAGLGAFAKAQEEGGKVFDALVKEGENIQAKTRKMTDERVAQVAGKAAGTWDRLEQVFEDRVARALGSLGVPTKQDIDRLSKRVVELSAAVQALTEGKPVAKAPARSVAKPAAKEVAEAEVVASPPATAKPAAAKPRAAAAKAVPPVTPADVLNTIPQKAGE